MTTYLLLNLAFMLAALVILRFKLGKPSRPIIITLIALLLLTAVFDNVLIGLSFIAYDTSKLLGIYIGNAPIEDFMYAILAVMLVPAVWHKLGAKHA